MQIPGTESRYKRSVDNILRADFKISGFSGEFFEDIYQKGSQGSIFANTYYVGILDERKVTPESLDHARNSLESQISEHYPLREKIFHEHHVVIVGVTDNVSSDTRSYIKENDSDMYEFGTNDHPTEIIVVDVSAGTVIMKNDRCRKSYIDELNEEYLQKPLR